jgi:ribose/xylose/arabinose/galactoside ABC-type transport system permease subunit
MVSIFILDCLRNEHIGDVAGRAGVEARRHAAVVAVATGLLAGLASLVVGRRARRRSILVCLE